MTLAQCSRLFCRSSVLSSARALVAGSLCALLSTQPLLAAAPSRPAAPSSTTGAGEVEGQARVLHALNRLTFGPRPGEVAAVSRMGLDRWFEQQLNPASIDDSALDVRLAQFPAMQLPFAELYARFPGPGEIRQMANGNLALPDDPTARALALDQIAFYQQKQLGKSSKRADGPADQAGQDSQAGQGSQAGQDMQQAGAGQSTPLPGKGSVAAGLDALDQTGSGTVQPPEKLPSAAEVNPVDSAGPAEGERPARAAMRAEIEPILQLPPQQRLKAVLAMQPAELVRFRQSLKPREVARLVDGMQPAQREILIALPGSLRMIGAEDMESRVLRDVYSNRELEAVMTDFWLNHFNVYLRKNQQEPYLLSSYERDTIRPHALGRFEDLLVATAESPAMQVYLDNFRSIGPDSRQAERQKFAAARRPNAPANKRASGLNENYGRELMELHTLGVNGGYTQADVTEVAKVFTGWGVAPPAQGGGFAFNENRHEPGSKTVLGVTIHEDGQKEGLEVLHMLATSPATAHFISQQLAVRFVSDTPPPALVDRMSQSFLSSGGDIRTVLRTMFHSPEFWAPAAVDSKVKTPEEFVFSAVRASGLEVRDGLSLVQALDRLGQPVYGMQTPNGYGWTKDGWVSTGALVSRMNFSLVLADDRLPGTRTEWTALLGEPAAGIKPASYAAANEQESAVESAADKERRLERILLGAPVSERTRETVLAQAQNTGIAEQAATEFDLNAAGTGKKNKQGAYGRVAQALERNSGSQTAQSVPDDPDDPQAAFIAGLLLGSPEFQRR